jgi:pimeloyl-ACP methyl ester carboxylesterase
VPYVDANGLRFNAQVLRGPAGADAASGDKRSRYGGTGDAGDARPAVVMLHGLVADNLSSFYYTIANPVALAADTYLYDMRGHGRTTVPAAGYTVADHVADLGALLDRWELDRPVHLVGNSFGGLVALAFTRRNPERVASLVLVEAHFPTEGWGEHMAGSLALAAFGLDERNVKEWLARNGTRKVSRLARHSERLFSETTLIDDLQREQPFPHDALAAIGCPVLAIYGSGSDILDRARDLERHVPRCELYVVDDCTHSVLFEATPFVRDHTVGWVTSHEPSLQAG